MSKFSYEPWTVTEEGFDPKNLRENESAFALANGFIGMRGNLEEGSAAGAETIQGSFLNGVFDSERRRIHLNHVRRVSLEFARVPVAIWVFIQLLLLA